MVRHGRPPALPLYKVQPADFQKRHAIYNEMSYRKTSVRLHTSLTPPMGLIHTSDFVHTTLFTPRLRSCATRHTPHATSGGWIWPRADLAAGGFGRGHSHNCKRFAAPRGLALMIPSKERAAQRPAGPPRHKPSPHAASIPSLFRYGCNSPNTPGDVLLKREAMAGSQNFSEQLHLINRMASNEPYKRDSLENDSKLALVFAYGRSLGDTPKKQTRFKNKVNKRIKVARAFVAANNQVTRMRLEHRRGKEMSAFSKQKKKKKKKNEPSDVEQSIAACEQEVQMLFRKCIEANPWWDSRARPGWLNRILLDGTTPDDALAYVLSQQNIDKLRFIANSQYWLLFQLADKVFSANGVHKLFLEETINRHTKTNELLTTTRAKRVACPNDLIKYFKVRAVEGMMQVEAGAFEDDLPVHDDELVQQRKEVLLGARAPKPSSSLFVGHYNIAEDDHVDRFETSSNVFELGVSYSTKPNAPYIDKLLHTLALTTMNSGVSTSR